MRQSLLFTFIADDKPGIIDTISKSVADCGGNWLESRLTKVGGKFSGIVQLSISDEKIETLKSCLNGLSDQGIAVLFSDMKVDDGAANQTSYSINIIGLDRPGIVKEISQALANRSINVDSMNSLIESAPMTGEPLFKAQLQISIPEKTDIEDLEDAIDGICQQLDIDYTLSNAD